MPTESFKDLALASFQWSVLKKSEVWGGFLGMLALGGAISYFARPKTPAASHLVCSLSHARFITPLAAFPISIGEESIFRGFLQSALLESLSPWGAITTSSLVFGAAHIPNALAIDSGERWRYYAFSLPLITTIGGYLGYLSYKNRRCNKG
jgi:membrane protease YdiL (CAAX protease family)